RVFTVGRGHCPDRRRLHYELWRKKGTNPERDSGLGEVESGDSTASKSRQFGDCEACKCWAGNSPSPWQNGAGLVSPFNIPKLGIYLAEKAPETGLGSFKVTKERPVSPPCGGSRVDQARLALPTAPRAEKM